MFTGCGHGQEENMKAGSGSMKHENNGTTMVTVVVSFALLLIFVTAFYKVQKLSENMMMDAKDLLVNNRELIKAYYLDETENTPAAENITLSFQGEEGGFSLQASLYRAEKEGLTGTIYYYKAEEE
jgi:hypothetical protein